MKKFFINRAKNFPKRNIPAAQRAKMIIRLSAGDKQLTSGGFLPRDRVQNQDGRIQSDGPIWAVIVFPKRDVRYLSKDGRHDRWPE